MRIDINAPDRKESLPSEWDSSNLSSQKSHEHDSRYNSHHLDNNIPELSECSDAHALSSRGQAVAAGSAFRLQRFRLRRTPEHIQLAARTALAA